MNRMCAAAWTERDPAYGKTVILELVVAPDGTTHPGASLSILLEPREVADGMWMQEMRRLIRRRMRA